MKEVEVVITGISGKFPKSDNMNELKTNLESKVDMIDTFWKDFHPENVSSRVGTLNDLEKFDSSFFSIPSKHANWIDPQIRLLIEKCYEAILDAGISPQSLIGSNTGVFVGCNADKRIPGNNLTREGYAVLG
jgi:fatty acid synthase, animal type